jgi:hypothetical protein
MSVIHEETTTLPEGAVISVYKCQTLRSNKTIMFYTQLTALQGAKRVDMRVDDVSGHNVRLYLELTVKAIRREREKLTVKPVMLVGTPKTMNEFVNNMAYYDMFIFEALNNEGPDVDNTTATKKVVERREQTEASSQVRTNNNGPVRRSSKTKRNRGRKAQ